jgi:spore germination protein Q
MNFYQQPCGGFGPQMPAGYVANPMFPGGAPVMFAPPGIDMGQMETPGVPFQEQSYIENILRLNLGKVATVYMNFENSQWGSKIFKGYLTAAGRDHIILKDLQSETRYILLMVYLLYVTFDEDIDYEYPFRNKSATKEK